MLTSVYESSRYAFHTCIVYYKTVTINKLKLNCYKSKIG